MTGNSKIKIIKIEVGEAPAGFYLPYLERIVNKPLKLSFLDSSEINPNLEYNFTREVLPIQRFAYNSSLEKYYMRDGDKAKFEELVNKYIDLYKQSLIKWLEGNKYPHDYWKTCETGGRYFCLCGSRIGKKDGRCIYCQTPYNQAIDTVINHIKES